MKRRTATVMVGVLALAAAASADTVILSAIRDNTMFSEGDLSNGAGQYIFAGRNDDGGTRRALLMFDIASQIPPGATINAVTLTLTMSRTIAGPQPVELRRAMADWGEGTSDASRQEGQGADATPGDATWAHRFFSTDLWTTPGGDFIAAASASQMVDQDGPYSWTGGTLGADVQGWLDDPASNFGWVLIGNEASGATAKRFDSRDGADPATRPQLTVDFTTGGVLPDVFESNIKTTIGPAIATATGSPFEFSHATDPTNFYQVDDGTGNPPQIFMTKGTGLGRLLIHY